MARELFLIKTQFNTFKPAFESDLDIAKKIKIGEPIKVKYSFPRNYEFHKKFFAMINLAYHNFDTASNIIDFRKEIVKRAGFYYEHVNFKGVTEYKALSISFASMDEIKFQDVYDKCLSVIFKHVLKLEKTDENLLNFQEELINFM